MKFNTLQSILKFVLLVREPEKGLLSLTFERQKKLQSNFKICHMRICLRKI